MTLLVETKFPENSPPWVQPRSAYVHIPFCHQRCCYCDFAIAVAQEQWIEQYLDALEAELRALGGPHDVETLFFGGGTPTHLDAKQLERLCTLVRKRLRLLPGHEFSIEANPASLTEEKLQVLQDHGVNRISLGVQSFHADLLRALNRDHTPEEALDAAERCRRRFPSVSLDLIFAVPGQTLAHWRDDLRCALAAAPDHMATYGLTYEKGTPLWKDRRKGIVLPLGEDAEWELYREAIDTLEASGFEQYEISNFARPGHRCRHNQIYWANWAYFGVGMGAAGYVHGVRRLNSRSLRTYIQRALSGKPTAFQSETLPPEERARETLALQLRRAEGIGRAPFLTQTGFRLDDLCHAAILKYMDQGLLCDTGDSVHLTRAGRYVADAVIAGMM